MGKVIMNVVGFLSLVRLNIGERGVFLFACQLIPKIYRKTWNWFLARRLGVKRINILQDAHIQGLNYLHIGENFSSGRGLWLHAVSRSNEQVFTPSIRIGNNVSISFWGHIAAIESVSIGDNVLIGSKVIITDHNHGSYTNNVHNRPDSSPCLRDLVGGPVVIGDNVWIGDGVVVMPNAVIGSGCVIGANALVRGSIPPNTIAVGCPARPVKSFDFTTGKWVKFIADSGTRVDV